MTKRTAKRSPRSARQPPPKRAARSAAGKRREPVARFASIEVEEIESLREELGQIADRLPAPRWNANPDDVKKSVAKLVLTLVEFIRQVLERQALRRMQADTLTAEETEAIGLALMRLEETIRDLAAQFDLRPEDLNLDLGPIGRLM